MRARRGGIFLITIGQWLISLAKPFAPRPGPRVPAQGPPPEEMSVCEVTLDTLSVVRIYFITLQT